MARNSEIYALKRARCSSSQVCHSTIRGENRPLTEYSEHSAQPGPFCQYDWNRGRAGAPGRIYRYGSTHPTSNVGLTRYISMCIDRLRWYCKSGAHSKPTIIREDAFHCTDLGTQLKPVIQNWINNESIRKCHDCGAVAEAK